MLEMMSSLAGALLETPAELKTSPESVGGKLALMAGYTAIGYLILLAVFGRPSARLKRIKERSTPLGDAKYKELPNKNLWWLGREVSFAYKDPSDRSTALKPDKEVLKKTAQKLGLSLSEAQKALDYYTWS